MPDHVRNLKLPRPKSIPVILIDNREQLNYNFEDYNIETLHTTLHTGDYSIAVRKGDELIRYDNEIAIERKTSDNFVSDLSSSENRERFESSVVRGSALKFYAIFIEGSQVDIENQKYEGRIIPKSIINTAIGWQVKHQVPISFCVNRFNAEYWTYTTLTMFLKYKKEGKI